MSKSRQQSAREKRDGQGGAILLIPHVVLNSEAYTALSGRAVKLLIDVAAQYNTRNNGALLASWRHMSITRGWTSSDALGKAKAELIEHDLIAQTVQGRLPNKASWYGLTWVALDDLKALEVTAQTWPRGAYRFWKPAAAAGKRRPPPLPKNASSCP